MRAGPRFLAVALAAFAFADSVLSQGYAPPAQKLPDAETQQKITAKIQKLTALVDVLGKHEGVRDPFLADIEVFAKAGDWVNRYKEYYSDDAGKWTEEVLGRGILRANLVLGGESPWLAQTGQAVVRGYRSRIDDSVQPYSVTLPRDYGKDPKVKWRLDVVLHGRGATLSEMLFIHNHLGDKPAPDMPYVLLEVYGRGNNGYRWAGETDILEAIDAFLTEERLVGRGDLIDLRRVVLRGFSMGGAGTWHLGLHRPDRWCVIGPGAGFTTTHGYVKDLPDKLPSYVESCLKIYDAVDYADNVFDVPVVAYAGDQDPQMQAALNIQKRLAASDIPMTLLTAPGLKHEFPAEWQAKAEAEYVKYAGPGKGRKAYPDHVKFTTYTMKFPICDWVEILGMDAHYRRAMVDATRNENGFTIKTTNVRALKLTLPPFEVEPQTIRIGDVITGQPIRSANGPSVIFLEQQAGKWVSVLSQKVFNDRLRRIQKMSGLQGPIDDAFTDSFLCVSGSGKAWNPQVQNYANADLKRFTEEWEQFYRGKLQVKKDVDVNESDIANRNLILFGDPGSNSLIGHVLDGLPLKWTKESLVFNGKTYDSASHVPVMIYPSPINLNRYVVLNSGHTFHAADFLGTNALLYPRLGDFAILKPTPTPNDSLGVEVVDAGLFDDFWKLPAK
jgi:predicted esterase